MPASGQAIRLCQRRALAYSVEKPVIRVPSAGPHQAGFSLLLSFLACWPMWSGRFEFGFR